MSGSGKQRAMRVSELMKFLRGTWASRAEVAAAVGWSKDCVTNWIVELTTDGILIERDGVNPKGTRGVPAKQYTLSPEWGGKAL